MSALGKALELVGILVTGVGLFVGLSRGTDNAVREELVLLAVGAVVFVAGWAIGKGASRR
jgi:hypothetical protein